MTFMYNFAYLLMLNILLKKLAISKLVSLYLYDYKIFIFLAK